MFQEATFQFCRGNLETLDLERVWSKKGLDTMFHSKAYLHNFLVPAIASCINAGTHGLWEECYTPSNDQEPILPHPDRFWLHHQSEPTYSIQGEMIGHVACKKNAPVLECFLCPMLERWDPGAPELDKLLTLLGYLGNIGRSIDCILRVHQAHHSQPMNHLV